MRFPIISHKQPAQGFYMKLYSQQRKDWKKHVTNRPLWGPVETGKKLNKISYAKIVLQTVQCTLKQGKLQSLNWIVANTKQRIRKSFFQIE